MAIFEEFEKKLQANPKSIVFTEGTDARILSAASKLLAAKTLKVILLGEVEAVKKAAADGGFDITGAELLDPKAYDGMDEMAAKMVELRKGKMTVEQCREALSKGNYFGTMLVKMGKADCLLGGATYSTADTVRPALQLIKCKPGISSVSSCFIMMRGEEKLAMADCAINIDPSEDEIVESTVETAHTAEIFGIEPRVALLSYSTKGSGKGETVDKMRNATIRVQEAHPELDVDGELQFDAAVAPEVGQLKAPGSKVAGCANTFIFPNINAGNIGYKIAQRLGGFDAYGPILQGLNAPSSTCIGTRSLRTLPQRRYRLAVRPARSIPMLSATRWKPIGAISNSSRR